MDLSTTTASLSGLISTVNSTTIPSLLVSKLLSSPTASYSSSLPSISSFAENLIEPTDESEDSNPFRISNTRITRKPSQLPAAVQQQLLLVYNCSPSAGAEGATARWMFSYLYLPLLTTCLLGNSAALVLYIHSFLRSSSTIRLLLGKAVVNMGFVMSLIPNFVYHFASLFGKELDYAGVYYHSLPYVMAIGNTCSTIGVWLAVGVGWEQYSLVVFPLQTRSVKCANFQILLCIPFAILFETYPLMAYRIRSIRCLGGHEKWLVEIIRNESVRVFREFSMWSHTVLVLFIPLLLLTVFSCGLYHQLFLRTSSAKTSLAGGGGLSSTNGINGSGGGLRGSMRTCILRLALATTMSHLILEMPGILVNFYALLPAHRGRLQPFVELANFLSLVNASIPFYIYFLFSPRFRHIFTHIFLPFKFFIKRAGCAAAAASNGGGGTADPSLCYYASTGNSKISRGPLLSGGSSSYFQQQQRNRNSNRRHHGHKPERRSTLMTTSNRPPTTLLQLPHTLSVPTSPSHHNHSKYVTTSLLQASVP